MAFVLILTGTLTANVNVLVPAESRVYVVDNRTTGAFTVTFARSRGRSCRGSIGPHAHLLRRHERLSGGQWHGRRGWLWGPDRRQLSGRRLAYAPERRARRHEHANHKLGFNDCGASQGHHSSGRGILRPHPKCHGWEAPGARQRQCRGCAGNYARHRAVDECRWRAERDGRRPAAWTRP